MPCSVLETQGGLQLDSCTLGAQQGAVGKSRKTHLFLPPQGRTRGKEEEPQAGVGEGAGFLHVEE